MKTKMGQQLLKKHSDQMGLLNREAKMLARKLAVDHKVKDAHERSIAVGLTISKFKDNRAEWKRLNDEVGVLCGLEWFLE